MVLGWLLLGGCNDVEQPAVAPTPLKPLVFASNPPLASFVRVLAEDAIELTTPWKSVDGDPAYWKPTVADIRAIQACDLVVLNGAGYEPWSEQAALSHSRTIDTTAALSAQLIHEKSETHTHGPVGAHAHAPTAFTTWLSPELASMQATVIAERLTQLLPERASEIRQQLALLHAALHESEVQLRAIAERQPRWLASHPVYQYLAQGSGLVIDSVHWEPNEMPSDEQWAALRALQSAKGDATRMMLWEGEPDAAIRAKLTGLGMVIVVFPPLGSSDNSAEFAQSFVASLQEMRQACDELERAR